MAGKLSSLRQQRRGPGVVPGLRALLALAPDLVDALHLAPLGVPAAPPRPAIVPALAAARLPAEPPPQPPNPRSPQRDPPRRASQPPRPPLCLLREPPSLAHAHAHVPALVLPPLTASAKTRVEVKQESTAETAFKIRIRMEE